MRRIAPIHWLALLFFLQALFFAWFVTPNGDIPDESGHYAYVVDVAKGRPLPVLGHMDNDRGIIPNNLWRDWGVEEGHRPNYIVQHPPLYYAVAAIPYKIAKAVTKDRFLWAKATRIVSALSLGLLILVMFKSLVAARVDDRLALLLASLFGFVPTVTHLSSGITNDIFLTLMCGLATLYLVRFVQGERMADAYWCAFWLACAGATKMTAWVLIAGFVGILLYEMRQRWLPWLLHSAALSLLSFSSALWWMRRNYYFFGNPFYISGSDAPPLVPGYTRLNYLEQQPFFDWLFQHFYALVGFSGYCNSAANVDILVRYCKGVKVAVVQGTSYYVFIWVSIAFSALLLWAVLRHAWRLARSAPEHSIAPRAAGSVQSGVRRIAETLRVPRWLPALLTMGGVAATAYGFIHVLKLDPRYTQQIHTVFAFMTVTALVSLALVATGRTGDDRLLAYGPILIALFSLLLFLQGHKAYVISERPAGIQGRYLFPFIPLLLVSFGIAIRGYRWALPVVAIATVLLAWAHTNGYMNTIVPWFNSVRL